MAVESHSCWRFSADTGGTFTDCIAVSPEGEESRLKVLSNGSLRGRLLALEDRCTLRVETEWTAAPGFCVGFEIWVNGRFRGNVAMDELSQGRLRLSEAWMGPLPESGCMLELRSQWEAPVLGARLLTRTNPGVAMPPMEFRLGTTRGTNALLEQKGAKVAFFVSEGFGDLCRIGDQRRPDLFALAIEKPDPLHHYVVEVPGRIALDGSVIEPFCPMGANLIAGVEAARAAGCTVAAVALLHSYLHPHHESALVKTLQELGSFDYVVGSAELRPFIHYLRRAETAIVDATLGPVMQDYLDAVEQGLQTSQMRVMTSAGELWSRARFRPVDSLLSGPAAGAVGAVLAGRRAGLERLIAFDMGGTSTDVSRWDGEFAYQSELQVGAARIRSRSVKIETVAAGGGSICRVENDRPFVGPASAGASPGPACYGAGGPLTITDVNLLLGRLDSTGFQIPISSDAARSAWESVGLQETGDAWLAGLLQLANERMAQAIRQISVRDGYDPANFGLVAFGGAGGMHACAVAGILGMKTIVFPRNAGLLSAEGLAHTPLSITCEKSMLCSLRKWELQRKSVLAGLREAALAIFADEGIAASTVQRERVEIDLRMTGQESSLTVDGAGDLQTAFTQQFREVFGYEPPTPLCLEVEAVRLCLSSDESGIVAEEFPRFEQGSAADPTPKHFLSSWFDGKRQNTPVFDREALVAGGCIVGPALVTEAFSTLVVAPGWMAIQGCSGTLRLTRLSDATERQWLGKGPESVQRELLLHRVEGLVKEMGEQLQRTALSTNIRERLDFSCALLSADGYLLVNAPHIPVHLGAIGECVRSVLQILPLRPGDVVITNHPAFGGSHLPDVTVFSGVFHDGGLVAIVANRAHHAELGGTRPGSMPPGARCLAEEGVVIHPQYLVETGVSRFDELESLLCNAPWPSRAVAENLADLRAQIAANRRGAVLLNTMIEAEGRAKVVHFLDAAAQVSEAACVRTLKSMGTMELHACDALDDGTRIELHGNLADGQLKLDFSGTGPVHSGNLNATPAIVKSAILYVLRLLVDEPLPLNEGMLRPVEIHLPQGLLNPAFVLDPSLCPAVVGGNVETSQRVVDVLLTAFALLAQGQGTMNNVIFGDDRFGYYETVGGGAGAGNGFVGASGVHVHMTNTAITDPEILEHRYPLRIRRFTLRHGSGGRGKWRGGDGLVREYEFLRKMQVSLLSQRRMLAPQGLLGGGAGACGRQTRIHADGRIECLGGLAFWESEAGERLVLETPGGAGWGAESSPSR